MACPSATIFREARALNAVIGGREATAFRSPLPKLAGADLAGRRVARVEARGKNLLVLFDDSGRLRHQGVIDTRIGGASVLVSEGRIEVGSGRAGKRGASLTMPSASM